MTAIMSDPIDHWLDLDQQQVRRPLREEMFSAFNAALDCPTDPPHRRAYWTGVGTGYAVGFGLVTREALEKARRIPRALPLTEDNCWNPSDDEETAWACGVLYGYQQGTAEHPDAEDCGHCGQRLLASLDHSVSCEHGVFCEDHIGDFHAIPGAGLPCTYEDERSADRWA